MFLVSSGSSPRYQECWRKMHDKILTFFFCNNHQWCGINDSEGKQRQILVQVRLIILRKFCISIAMQALKPGYDLDVKKLQAYWFMQVYIRMISATLHGPRKASFLVSHLYGQPWTQHRAPCSVLFGNLWKLSLPIKWKVNINMDLHTCVYLFAVSKSIHRGCTLPNLIHTHQHKEISH